MKQYYFDRLDRTSKSILKYSIELLIVAFGVFLGIYIGERNNQQKTDANVKDALTQIISEFDLNSDRLKHSIVYHEKVSVELDSVTNTFNDIDFGTLYYNNKKFQYNELPSWKGVGTAFLSNSVYDSAKIGGIFQELNISTIILISQVYEHQILYGELTKSTIDKLINFDSNTKTGDVVGTLGMLTKYDIASMEKSLLNLIKLSKKQLELIIRNNEFKK